MVSLTLSAKSLTEHYCTGPLQCVNNIRNVMDSMKKQIPGFDILKFIMAILIVSIHADLANAATIDFLKLGRVIQVLQSFAVPEFFVISSFLFFRKCFSEGIPNSKKHLKKFVLRLAYVYLFYFVLLSPVIIPNRGWFSMGVVSGALTFFEDLLLRYTFPGSWFLSALVVASTIVFILLSYRIKPYLLIGIFFLLHLYISNVNSLPENLQMFYLYYEEHIRDIRLSFPVALFWVGLGALMAYPPFQSDLCKLQKYKILVWATFFVAFICEYYKIGFRGVFGTLIVVCLFLIFYNINLKTAPIYKRLREYSILFFFWHFIVLQIFTIIFHDATTAIEVLDVWLFVITVIAVFFISTFILWLENKRGMNWIKYSH